MELEDIEREEVELKQQLALLLAQKEENLVKRKLENFVPNPKQFKFFEAAAVRLRAGFCGNRFGKSTLGVVEDCCWLLGERPFFPVDHPLRRLGIPKHGVRGLVIAEDWDKVDEIFTNNESADRPGKFFEFLPEESIKSTTKGQKGQINSITVKNTIDGKVRESTVIFDTVRSYVNNPKSFESSDWDFIHYDEPVPEDLHKAVSRGLIDRGGSQWWLLTPLGYPWMYEVVTELAKKDPSAAWWFEATMDDNPTLDQVAKEAYLATLTPEEIECRKNGKPLAFGRKVYGFYDEAVHVWNMAEKPPGWHDWNVPPLSYLCGYAIDPHPQTPHAVLFTAISPEGDVFFYDEIFEKALIGDLSDKIIAKCKKVRIGWEICDPIAWIENPDTGRCWAETFYAKGLSIVKASKEKTAGIITTQEIFSPKFHRKVWVMPHMARFRYEIKKYFFDRENKAIDKDDHIMECLYRTVVHNNLTFFAARENDSRVVEVNDEFANFNYKLDYMSSINI